MIFINDDGTKRQKPINSKTKKNLRESPSAQLKDGGTLREIETSKPS